MGSCGSVRGRIFHRITNSIRTCNAIGATLAKTRKILKNKKIGAARRHWYHSRISLKTLYVKEKKIFFHFLACTQILAIDSARAENWYPTYRLYVCDSYKISARSASISQSYDQNKFHCLFSKENASKNITIFEKLNTEKLNIKKKI